MTALDTFISQFDSPETRRAYKKDIILFLSTCGKKKLKNVTKIDAINFLTKLKRKKLAASSIRRMFASLRSYFKFLLDADIVQKNPFMGVKLPRLSTEIQPEITDKDLKKINRLMRGKSIRVLRDKAVIYLMLYGGLRRSEICDLNKDDLVRKKQGMILRIRGKGKKVRIRPLHPKAWKAIKEYLLKDKRIKIIPGKPIFTSESGKRLRPDAVYNCVKKYGEKIKRNLHPHMLRAKFASLAFEAGLPVTSIQADMGHASSETTTRYDRSRERFDRSGVLKIRDPLR